MPTRYQVPAEVDAKGLVTDQQMDTPDGRIVTRSLGAFVAVAEYGHRAVTDLTAHLGLPPWWRYALSSSCPGAPFFGNYTYGFSFRHL